STTFSGKKRGSLNEHSRIVFRFDLDDGRRGVGVADPFAPTHTPTPSSTPTLTDTPGPPMTPRPTSCGRRCLPPTDTPAPTTTGPPNPTSTPPPARCSGDCDGNNAVAINELIQMVNFALGTSTNCSACPHGIPAGDLPIRSHRRGDHSGGQ